jgi:predicted nucleotidyltransferase
MQNEIREALRRTCEYLNKHGVDYILIGGVAVGFYGFPRSTADIDFWYNPQIQNFQKILNSFKEQGIEISELENLVFDPGKTYLRVPQLGFRTEFLPHIPGIKKFSEAKKNATVTELDGVRVWILSYEDLIKNKEAVNRDIDKLDVSELKKKNQKP